jgi:hypothetical protein
MDNEGSWSLPWNREFCDSLLSKRAQKWFLELPISGEENAHFVTLD